MNVKLKYPPNITPTFHIRVGGAHIALDLQAHSLQSFNTSDKSPGSENAFWQ